MTIKVSQAFERTSAAPIDTSIALTKAQMLTVNDSTMPAYYFTICQDDGDIYIYDKSATASATTGKFTRFAGGGSTITIDSAFSTTSTNPVQNKVITTAIGTLTSLTTTDKTSLVNAINEVNAKIAGHVIVDTNGTAKTQRKNLQFIGLDVKDDSLTATTEVESFGLNSDSLDDVTAGDVNPSYYSGEVYSTDEQVVGKWVDGKPIYQKTFNTTLPNATTDGTEVVGNPISIGANIDNIVHYDAFSKTSSGTIQPISTLKANGTVIQLIRIVFTDNNAEASIRNSFRLINAWTNNNGADVTVTVKYTKS